MHPPAPETIRDACQWVTAHCRRDADAALREGMETVEILRTLKVDAPALYAGLLQPLLPLNDKEQAAIAGQFGDVTMDLLRGAATMQKLSMLSADKKTDSAVNEENLRKMLIAMVDDIRVVLIELARHLTVLRNSREVDGDMQRELGRMTVEVYAPLAGRLGVGQIKWQMEDHALRCMAPSEYQQLAARLDETRTAREKYVDAFITAVHTALAEVSITGDVTVYGRPKHLYGIWKKMRRKDLAFENLRDIRAVRIIVDNVADCYAALAAVHTRWTQLPAEFADYIATPKQNGYQSIHTVVADADGKDVEVQIRTHEMHEQNEFGGAAHWRYKEAVRADDGIDDKVARLRQLLEWQESLRDVGAVARDEKQTTDTTRVYVFTPKGKVIDLPAAATSIDFAYAIHTDIGHGIRGAQINGKMTPLSHQLRTGEQVHIQTVKGGQPSRDWLRKDLNFVRTRRARNRIANWFKRADYDLHLAEGRAMLERELARLGMEDLSYDKIARDTPFHKTDDLLAAIGANDFKLSRALAPFRRAMESDGAQHRDRSSDGVRHRDRDGAKHRDIAPDGINVSGVGNVLTRLAQCCNPIAGDAIVGFITAGRGISIHRRDCHNITNLDDDRRTRVLEVQWGTDAPENIPPVEVWLTAYHRNGLLNDITELLKREKIQTRALNMESDSENNARIQLRLEIPDRAKGEHILKHLARIPDVFEVRRARK